ncbi:hypothetical protein A2W24_03725 [Microgenomates group bacterium RBG_16_45_19]|nr:MAG: hypothetical protein A2W24_03725 [Microgenomates group bacterium RBG_16_45_19]
MDVIVPEHRLIIVGSGHIALPLAKLADILGFRIILIDDNKETATKERFPMVEQIAIGELGEILDRL